MKAVIKENILKNAVVLLILALLYFPIKSFLLGSEIYSEKALAGNFLIATSILSVIAAFGGFAFTYEKTNVKNRFQRYFGHFTSGILMLLLGISIILTSVVSSFFVKGFIFFDLALFLLYVSIMAYDFWDLFRNIG